MLIGRGPRTASFDLVDLLRECHQRIRQFSDLAVAIAARREAPIEQVVDACADVRRYFREALPLHVADEEESILPRLVGQDSQVDEALVTMHRQHSEHEPMLQQLLAACSIVQSSPGALEDLRAQILQLATEFRGAFESHLMLEESRIFPSLGSLLSPEVQNEIVQELRGRRNAAQSRR
jgi:iron-sulfur cluster repair protein YtfE (RIC family)